jgi:hypothetical protein
MRRLLCVSLAAGIGLLAVSCSSRPAPPKPGSPAFFWSAARTTYAAGDFLKAHENLQQLAKGESEFAARAQPWAVILPAGISQAYAELADSFDAGARLNRANPMPFRRQASMFRKLSANYALQSAEGLQKVVADKADTLVLALPFPSGSAAEPVALQRIATGILFPDTEIEALQRAMVQRGVLLSVARFTGADDDAAKALELFKAGEVKVPRPVFLLAGARAMHRNAGLFVPTKLDQPDRINLFCDQAEQALKGLPGSKEITDLSSQIAKSRKAASRKS